MVNVDSSFLLRKQPIPYALDVIGHFPRLHMFHAACQALGPDRPLVEDNVFDIIAFLDHLLYVSCIFRRALLIVVPPASQTATDAFMPGNAPVSPSATRIHIFLLASTDVA